MYSTTPEGLQIAFQTIQTPDTLGNIASTSSPKDNQMYFWFCGHFFEPLRHEHPLNFHSFYLVLHLLDISFIYITVDRLQTVDIIERLIPPQKQNLFISIDKSIPTLYFLYSMFTFMTLRSLF